VSHSGEKDVRFERMNWKLRWGSGQRPQNWRRTWCMG